MLLIGAIKRNTLLLKIYVLVSLIGFGIYAIIVVIVTIFAAFINIFFALYIAIVFTMGLCIAFYFTVCVNSYLMELEDQKNNQVPEMSENPDLQKT